MNIENIISKNIKSLSLLQLIRLLNFEHKNIHSIIKRIHISPNLTLACTTSDFEEIKFKQDSYDIISNFLCLYGTSSVLPTFYTEELIYEKQFSNDSLESFYNIFNRRAYQLLMDILIKNRLILSIYELKDQKSLNFIYSFLGLTPLNTNTLKYLKEFKLLRYINILNNSVKSVNALEIFLNDLFDITFKVIEYVKIKINIHKEQLNQLGVKNSHLGTCYLGNKIKDITTTVKIILVDLTNEEFNSFLPGQIKFEMLIEAIKLFFENNAYSYILDYSIQKKIADNTNFILGKRNYSRLGMSTCLGVRKNNYIYNHKYLLLQ